MRSSNRAGPGDEQRGAASRPGGLIGGAPTNYGEFRRPKGIPPRVQDALVTHCRKCKYQMGNIGTTLCPECGTNNDPELHARKKPKNALGLKKCPVCDYDLAGLKGALCPECGTVITRRGMSRARSIVDKRRHWQRLWVSAGVMAVVAAGWPAVLWGVGGDAVWVSLTTVLNAGVLCGVVCFFAVFTKVGLPETWAGTLIKSPLIGALMGLTGNTGFMIAKAIGGMGILILLPSLVQVLVGLWLLSWLMDYDIDEAMWLSGLSFVVCVIGGFVIAALL